MPLWFVHKSEGVPEITRGMELSRLVYKRYGIGDISPHLSGRKCGAMYPKSVLFHKTN